MEACFQQGKHRALLVEINGKQDALSRKPIFEQAPVDPSFEVYDPVGRNWTSLHEPPFLDFDNPLFKFAPFSYIVTGSKIYVTTRNVTIHRNIFMIEDDKEDVMGRKIYYDRKYREKDVHY